LEESYNIYVINYSGMFQNISAASLGTTLPNGNEDHDEFDTLKQEARGRKLGDMTGRHSGTSISSVEVNLGLSSAHQPGEEREREGVTEEGE
jgi:hypothetical protein